MRDLRRTHRLERLLPLLVHAADRICSVEPSAAVAPWLGSAQRNARRTCEPGHLRLELGAAHAERLRPLCLRREKPALLRNLRLRRTHRIERLLPLLLHDRARRGRRRLRRLEPRADRPALLVRRSQRRRSLQPLLLHRRVECAGLLDQLRHACARRTRALVELRLCVGRTLRRIRDRSCSVEPRSVSACMHAARTQRPPNL
jgi:hypothetical protein